MIQMNNYNVTKKIYTMNYYTNLSTHHIIFNFLLLANQIHLIAKVRSNFTVAVCNSSL